MTYNDFLANRVRKAFANKNAAYTETVSFGQLNFLVNDCFCAGVNGEELEIRWPAACTAANSAGSMNRGGTSGALSRWARMNWPAMNGSKSGSRSPSITTATSWRTKEANRGVSRGAARAFLCRFPVFVRVGVSCFAGALRIAPVLFPIVFRLSPGIPGPFPRFSCLFSVYV